jgi:hypothetical protein
MCAAVADDQDDEIQAQKEEAKQRKERYTTWMRDFSKGSAVRVTMPGEDEDTEADLVGNPVFRFHTQEITNGGTLEIADDGTLWIWTVDSRPVAVQKLEVCNIGGRLWTICFGSVSEGLVTVNWPGERRYRAMQPGVKYRPIPGAEAPSDKALTRNAQLKALKSRFTGLLGRFIADEKGAVEVKPITTPLYQYADKDSKLPLGAIFSMVNDKAGALNPGLLLILEARPDGTGKWRWEYGIVRLGMGQQLVRLDGVEVWRSAAVTTINDQIHDNWTFYFIKREFE